MSSKRGITSISPNNDEPSGKRSKIEQEFSNEDVAAIRQSLGKLHIQLLIQEIQKSSLEGENQHETHNHISTVIYEIHSAASKSSMKERFVKELTPSDALRIAQRLTTIHVDALINQEWEVLLQHRAFAFSFLAPTLSSNQATNHPQRTCERRHQL